MYGFNKIILSRKGYDSSAGGDYSPFDPETGEYIVLPIPVKEEEAKIGNATKYKEILIKANYLPRCSASNTQELIDFLKKKQTINKIPSTYAHFDPWLGHCPWLDDSRNHNIGAFGQVGAAQTHLDKQGIKKGSLFIFFSRFVPTNTQRSNLEKGVYFIYGWLKVGKIIKRFEDIEDARLKQYHPHATKKYYTKHSNNTIYLADEFLFEGSSIPGCGYFNRLDKKLLLTSQHDDIPSKWELPLFFNRHKPTYFTKDVSKWRIHPDKNTCMVKSPARGQEFVFEESPEFDDWFRNLFQERN